MRPIFWGILALVACERTSAPTPEPAASAAAATRPLTRPLEFRKAPPGSEPIEALVQRERAEAQASGQRLIVYVGASWCEPCQRFHHAAEEGKLDGQLPPVRFLEFDLDRDSDRLKAAGYRSRMIPLFAVPGSDGRGSGQQIEGSIKGEGAVAEIAPRLKKLLESAP